VLERSREEVRRCERVSVRNLWQR